MSLSPKDEKQTSYGNYNVYGNDLRLDTSSISQEIPTAEKQTAKDIESGTSAVVGIIVAVALVVGLVCLAFVGTLDMTEEAEYDAQLTTQPIPATGTILSGKEYFNQSEIQITAPKNHDCVVSLKNVSGVERVTFYVRKDETVTVGVPADQLYVYFAIGDTWYGYGEGLMFGKGTEYSKDASLKDFYTYTWEYVLQSTSNGNFSETTTSEDEFF